jgi:hypothetical protein
VSKWGFKMNWCSSGIQRTRMGGFSLCPRRPGRSSSTGYAAVVPSDQKIQVRGGETSSFLPRTCFGQGIGARQAERSPAARPMPASQAADQTGTDDKSVDLVRVLTLKRQGPERAARLCSNRADIRWSPATSAGSAPAHATAIDQAASSSHRGDHAPADTGVQRAMLERSANCQRQ